MLGIQVNKILILLNLVDNYQLFTELLVPLDLTRLEDLDTKPNKDLLFTEFELEGVEERDPSEKERLWVNQRTRELLD